MSKSNLIIGRDLGRAICKHFGIDTTKHVVGSDFEIETEPGTPVTVKLTLMLSADDLAGIARAAGADCLQVGSAKWGTETMPRSMNEIDPGFMRPVFSATAGDTPKRYGVSQPEDREAEILKTLEAQHEKLKQIQTCLYEIAKNTKRSACLAEDAAATSGTVLRD